MFYTIFTNSEYKGRKTHFAEQPCQHLEHPFSSWCVLVGGINPSSCGDLHVTRNFLVIGTFWLKQLPVSSVQSYLSSWATADGPSECPELSLKDSSSRLCFPGIGDCRSLYFLGSASTWLDRLQMLNFSFPSFSQHLVFPNAPGIWTSAFFFSAGSLPPPHFRQVIQEYRRPAVHK